MLHFDCDYMEGAHPEILARLAETNLVQAAGYGEDDFCVEARSRIREVVGASEAEVFFLVGGTQTNAVVIKALLRPWEGAVAAATGHIAVHEAGAIELGGHKVFTLPAHEGKLDAKELMAFVQKCREDGNAAHMAQPGLVYISQPTEYGTLYSKAELTALREVCDRFGLPLYVDGARLAYALASPANDVSLKDLARLADVFYIGGTKCGALLGEALVFPRGELVPHFFTIVKQMGALLAKGRVLGVQFEALFTDGLYERAGAQGIRTAMRIKGALKEKGYELYLDSPTNQQFIVVTKEQAARLGEQVSYSFMEELADGRLVVRLCTSWATKDEDVTALIELL